MNVTAWEIRKCSLSLFRNVSSCCRSLLAQEFVLERFLENHETQNCVADLGLREKRIATSLTILETIRNNFVSRIRNNFVSRTLLDFSAPKSRAKSSKSAGACSTLFRCTSVHVEPHQRLPSQFHSAPPGHRPWLELCATFRREKASNSISSVQLLSKPVGR